MIEVAASGIHGTGVFATEPIEAGTFIDRYAGRRYTSRQAACKDWDHGVTYVFGLSNGGMIDAAEGGNATRHLNHSCEPNCVAYEERARGGRLDIAFYALRAIAPGEELVLDYSLQVSEFDDASPFDCACGTKACRGTMLAQEAS